MKKGRKITIIVLSSFFGLIIAFLLFAFINHRGRNNVIVADKIENDTEFIVASGKALYDKDGNEIILRGTNSGGLFCTEGWLEPYYVNEDYMEAKGWDSSALSEEQFRQALKDNPNIQDKINEAGGFDNFFDELMDDFYQNFFTEYDVKKIHDLGLNCLRIPFYWKNILKSYTEVKDDAFKYLDDIISWCNEYDIYVILDLHGCPVSQNGYEHGGSIDFNKYDSNTIDLWDDEDAINATILLWEAVSAHYKNNPTVAAYDIMNEPRSRKFKTDKTCHVVFDRIYKAIRKIDTNHIIMMEGCWDFSTLPNPDDYGWENVVYEYHWYNWYTKFLPYELFYWYQDLSNIFRDYDVPVFIGEFTFFEDNAAWQKGLNLFEDRHYSWTCWTYKKDVTGDYNDSWGLINLNTYDSNMRVDVNTASVAEIKATFAWCKTEDNLYCTESDTCDYITKFLDSRK